MKLIVKKPIGKKEWGTVFCVGDHACEIGGQISNTVFEKMRSQGIIHMLDSGHLIGKHFKHDQLISESKSHYYFVVGLSEEYGISTVYKTELFCDYCTEIIVPVHKHIFEKDHHEKIKCVTNNHCPKCNHNLYKVYRYFGNEKEIESHQEVLKQLGQTWTKTY